MNHASVDHTDYRLMLSVFRYMAGRREIKLMATINHATERVLVKMWCILGLHLGLGDDTRCLNKSKQH